MLAPLLACDNFIKSGAKVMPDPNECPGAVFDRSHDEGMHVTASVSAFHLHTTS